MANICQIRIGTSGWHYEDWRGAFYPKYLNKKEWLKFYSRHFNTVEINNSFYHLPLATTFETWREQTPQDFHFTVKANRYITHIKKLNNCQETLPSFLTNARELKEKFTAVLYQFPPNFHKNIDKLKTFLDIAQNHVHCVLEFRHNSWYNDQVFEIMAEYNTALCLHDLSTCPTPKVITADLIYLRFHGSEHRKGNYSTHELEKYAEWINANRNKAKKILAYFNNDYKAFAIKNAATLRSLIQ
jgi:uncharacterized protein YecE (DUF72 family)